MRFSTAAAAALVLATTGPALAQPAPVPQFGLPTPSAFTSKIGFFTPERIEGASYPRVIQLKVGTQKGTLLATFARRGRLPIFRSTDNGDTWQQFFGGCSLLTGVVGLCFAFVVTVAEVLPLFR